MLVDPNSSPSQQVAGEEQSRLVAEAVSRLPDDYRQTIVLSASRETHHSGPSSVSRIKKALHLVGKDFVEAEH